MTDLFTPERNHGDPGRMTFREIELSGRRVLRCTTYNLADDDDVRVLVWTGWKDDGPLPLSSHCVSFPLAVLPELRAALDAIEGEK
jgi:hypothetical protein